jgi:NAD/NADP transhydrogenase beta subunit
VPESRVRKKKPFVPPNTGKQKASYGSSSWWAPVMIAFFVFGLLWIVVYYIAGTDLPVMRTLGWLNILIGFGFIGVGFGMSMRWR